jgi:3-oxoacyl-[acyl-carrier protein] reductase
VSTGIVIGAAGGIGSACARALDGSVDQMVLAGRRREPLEGVAAGLAAAKVVVPADVATSGGRDAIVGAVGGPIAWLVLASGVPIRGAVADVAEDEIAAAFAANLVGPALLLRRLLDLQWDRSASVAVIGSIVASRSLAGRAVYAATKAGIEHFARSLAPELAPAGIRVNVISPGVIETPFIGGASAALSAWANERVPLGRLGAAEEIADVVRYVILGAPEYLTGARIAVDGGAEAVA